MKFLVFLLLILSSHAFGNDCKEVNLVTKKGSPFNKIPVYDQDGAGLCYAYAASQIVDYHLIQKGSKSRSIHPLWVSLKYSDSEWFKSDLTGGRGNDAIKALLKSGNCHQAQVTNGLSEWAKKAKLKEAELIGFLEKVIPKINSQYRGAAFTRSPFKAPLPTEAEVKDTIKKVIHDFKPYCSATADLEKLMPELLNIGIMSSERVVGSLVLNECKKITKLNIPNPIREEPKKDEDYARILKARLNKNAPVTISYCAKVLYDPKYDGLSDSFWSSRNTASECGRHESLIVGKKMVNNQCHFLLRNSWGAGFGSSTKSWKCLCKNKKTGAFLDNCERSKHNNGQYTVEGCWINESSLSKNTYGITYLAN